MEFRSKLLNKTRATISSEENNNQFVSFITLILLIIVVVAFILPAINNTKKLIQENADLRRKKEILVSVRDTYAQSSKFMEEISAIKGDIYNKIPTNPDPASVVGDLTYYATFNNLNLDTLSLQKKEGGSESYVMRFNGRYSDIVSFFQTINNSPRYIKIVSISLTPNDRFDNNSSELSLIINVEAFYNE